MAAQGDGMGKYFIGVWAVATSVCLSAGTAVVVTLFVLAVREECSFSTNAVEQQGLPASLRPQAEYQHPIAPEPVRYRAEAQLVREQEEAQREREAAEQQRREEAEAERQREAEERRLLEEEAAQRQREVEAQRQREVEEQQRREAEAERQRQAAEAAEAAMQRQLAGEAEAAANTQQAEQAFNSFINIVRRRVEQKWTKPDSASDSMRAALHVRLGPSGEVLAVSIVTASGDSAFDRSAMQAVERAAPFGELRDLPAAQQRNARQFNLRFR